MKKTIILVIAFLSFIGRCSAQLYLAPQEHFLLYHYFPKISYATDTEKSKPAGAEVFVPRGLFLKKYREYKTDKDTFHWSFISLPWRQAIAIQTPVLPYYGATTMLRITDTTRTVVREVPTDTIRSRLSEYISYSKETFKRSIPFLKKKKGRVNMIIQNDSLEIFLINIKPKNIDLIRETVTKPVERN